jgi:hypothetical protein
MYGMNNKIYQHPKDIRYLPVQEQQVETVWNECVSVV